jgi:hypothetical protein
VHPMDPQKPPPLENLPAPPQAQDDSEFRALSFPVDLPPSLGFTVCL